MATVDPVFRLEGTTVLVLTAGGALEPTATAADEQAAAEAKDLLYRAANLHERGRHTAASALYDAAESLPGFRWLEPDDAAF